MRIGIFIDNYPESPRDWDNLGTMVCFHGRYNLGDDHNYSQNNYDSWEELEKDLVNTENTAIILPLYLYDHSGLLISTTPFSCRWDSGQVGFIFISKEKIREEYSVKRITKKLIEKVESYLINEVETYNQYLSGDVYKLEIIDDDDEVVDFYGTFYGEESIKLEAESVASRLNIPKENIYFN